ncbi:MAG: hypothetical protein CMG57_05160 [Candidatus Marinimicrobia bacterium]|nr:hypothetical protein [Candidatus Neomarinimicrobiota bacterium]
MIIFLKLIVLYWAPARYMLYCVFTVIILHSCEDKTDDDHIVDYGLVINEINYNSSDNFNPNDWVEIYNNSSNTIDLGLWIIKDENDEHVFTIKSNTMIKSDQYIIFCRDTLKFTEFFPDVGSYYGDLGFGLSGNSDIVRLFDSNGSLVDIVEYDDNPPWPVAADGNGPTLELRHPTLDNLNSKSWSPSEGYGTPGALNSTYDGDL